MRSAVLARAASRPATALYLLPALALYGLFVLWPMIEVGRLALYRWSGYGARTWVGLANFATLWSDALFRTSLAHSALWELGAMVVPTIAGLEIALLVAQSRGRSLIVSAFFFPALLPATVIAAVWVLVYSPVSGLLDVSLRNLGLGGIAADWLGNPRLALGALFAAWAWSAVGVGTLIFWAGINAIGHEYRELAMVEGAGALWRFRHVTLPGLRRVGFVVLLVNAALGAQVFDLIFVTTGGGPGYATMIVPLDMYGRAFGGRAGQGAAVACVQVALGLTLTALALLAGLGRGESLDSGNDAGAQGRRQSGWGATAAISCAVLLFLLPPGWLLLAALEPGRLFALGTLGTGFDPRLWAWSNFSTVWNTGMSEAIATSLLLALGVVLATMLLATPCAFALAHLMRARRWTCGALVLFLVGLLQPTLVIIIPLFTLLKDLGLLDSVWGILLPETARNLPFAVLVLWGFMAQSPGDVVEAAKVEGASSWQQMTRIAVPLSKSALYAVAVWSFVTSWNEYLLPTLVSQDGSLQTVPTLLATFIGKYDTQFGLLAAGSLMAALPMVAIYLVLRAPAAAGLAGAERRIR